MNGKNGIAQEGQGANVWRGQQRGNQKPGVLQRKSSLPSQKQPPPVAPPAYRPQPAARAVQPKTAQAKPSSVHPKVSAARQSAPEVYRPQNGAQAAQPKMRGHAQVKSAPVAPPVYRPQSASTSLQTKKANTTRSATPNAGLRSPLTQKARLLPSNPARQSSVQAKVAAAPACPSRVCPPTTPTHSHTHQPTHRHLMVRTQNVAQPTWGWGSIGALVAGGATGLATGGVGLLALGTAAIGGYVAHKASDWYYGKGTDYEFAPTGANDGEPIRGLRLSDNQSAAVNVDLQPRGTGKLFASEDVYGKPMRDILYLAKDITVRDIRIGRGRLDTGRGGNKQGAHSQAWTFFAYSLEAMKGRSLDKCIMEVFVLAQSVAKHPHQDNDALRKIEGIRYELAPNFKTAQMGIDQWQRFFASLLATYVEAYQLSNEATYIKPGIHGSGHGRREDLYRDHLIEAEENMRYSGNPGATQGEIVDWASRLIDVSFSPSLGKEGYARAVWGWRRGLYRSFPKLMGAMGAAIEGAILNVPLAPTWQELPNVLTVRDLVTKYSWV